MAVPIGICAKCGMIRQIYDRRADVCYGCYSSMSAFAFKVFAAGERRIGVREKLRRAAKADLLDMNNQD